MSLKRRLAIGMVCVVISMVLLPLKPADLTALQEEGASLTGQPSGDHELRHVESELKTRVVPTPTPASSTSHHRLAGEWAISNDTTAMPAGLLQQVRLPGGRTTTVEITDVPSSVQHDLMRCNVAAVGREDTIRDCPWTAVSWFGRQRDPILDGPFRTTSIVAAEARSLEVDANTTNDAAWIERHERREWRSHWVLRHPSVQWSTSIAKRPSKSLPTEVLEAYEQNQQEAIRASQAPKVDSDLEFISTVPPLLMWRRPRPEERWEQLDQSRRDGSGRSLRMACLYAGFLRDGWNMFLSCTDRKRERACLRDRAVWKQFGQQRDNIIHATQCDVFVSTWNIKGAGRYSTTTYDMRDMVDPKTIQNMYGPQLAALHVQNISEYQQLWRYMHKFTRAFPQTRPTKLLVDQRTHESAFTGHPELNFVIRMNDYSQSYKHWCVAHLALMSTVAYDVFFRLRFDLRSTAKLHNLRPSLISAAPSDGVSTIEPTVTLTGTDLRAISFQLDRVGRSRRTAPTTAAPLTAHNHSGADRDRLHRTPAEDDEQHEGGGGADRRRFVSATRIHMNNFDIADFGFMGPPFMIEELSRLWYYCLAAPSTPLASFDAVNAVTPSAKYSEYNLMLWRIVFDNQWTVDSGGRYLWVSRYGSRRTR